MVKGKVIFEDEEKVEIKYPCFELKDVVEYYFEICTPNNSINPFSLVALPNANTLVSIYLSDSSQTFKVHREHGIIDTSGDKISGSLTEAITVIHAPGTHEFSIKFKPGVLYSCLSKDISTLVDNHLSLQKYLNQKVIDELKLQSSFAERVQFVENWLLSNMKIFSSDFKLNTVIKAIYYINNNRNLIVNINRSILKKVLNISIWVMIQHGLVFGGWFVFFITVEHLGERSLATTNIVRNISSFLFMFVQAFASVNSSLVSNLIGEGKSDQVMKLCRKSILLCYLFVLPVALFIAIYPNLILRTFTNNIGLITYSIPPLLVMLSSYLIAVPTFVWFCAVSGTGNTLSSLRIAVVSLFIYISYITTVVSYIPNLVLLWASEHIYFSGLLILSLYFLLYHNWKHTKL